MALFLFLARESLALCTHFVNKHLQLLACFIEKINLD